MQNYLAAKNAIRFAFAQMDSNLVLLAYTPKPLSGMSANESALDLYVRAVGEATLKNLDPITILICDREEAFREHADVLTVASQAIRDLPSPALTGQFLWVHQMQLRLAPIEERTDPGYLFSAITAFLHDQESMSLESPSQRPPLWVRPTTEEIDIEGQLFPVYQVHHSARLFAHYQVQPSALDWIPIYLPAAPTLPDMLMQALVASEPSYDTCLLLRTLHERHDVAFRELLSLLPGVDEKSLRRMITIAHLPEKLQETMRHRILSFDTAYQVVTECESLGLALEPVMEWTIQEDATNGMIFEVICALHYGDAGEPVTLTMSDGSWHLLRAGVAWNPFATQ